MTNSNCLEGIKCPACGNEDRFLIAGKTVFTVTDDGTEDHGDIEWDGGSHAECPECGLHGNLKMFRAKPAPLPPDPDGMNFDRASWADQAVSAFMEATGTDREDALGDLLADLMHWADRAGYGFDEALDRARGHYAAETTADGSVGRS